jgi:hypothetical protein
MTRRVLWMIDRGVQLSDSEFAGLVAYLAATYK